MLTSQNFHGSSHFEPKIFEPSRASSQKFSSHFRAEPKSSHQIFEPARAMLEPATFWQFSKLVKWLCSLPNFIFYPSNRHIQTNLEDILPNKCLNYHDFQKSDHRFWLVWLVEPFEPNQLRAEPSSSQKFSSHFRAEPKSSHWIFEPARAMAH